ncbi:hypothetical protein PMZ80_000890 [Knufia obscura]|uniref:Coiled-coil domain-containing protein 16 n=1 Tax=Knufia obscura TaxID=1635080 RepID=A0ABR0S233_9EURO|nr:hypothetical protein PMZ80_000890 [Knufia obscura]
MADVRALLAAERQSRRISHPHLTYSKNGALTCNLCSLNIKSEQLWPGHLKSLNHRKNAQKFTEPSHPAKRKIESVEHEEGQERNYEVDSRKKPKSAPETRENSSPATKPDDSAQVPLIQVTDDEPEPPHPAPSPGQQQQQHLPPEPPTVDVDEDEWAAFERDVAQVEKPDFASATIEAAPVSAAQLAEQQRTNPLQQREDEAEAEKEDESRRMEEEFEVMEEMEDRVKRLRARREALRTADPTAIPTDSETPVPQVESKSAEQDANDESSDDEDGDDWYT